MNREKQIEEMANDYYEAMLKARGTLGSMNEGAPKWYAKEFYAKGYRKQAWISVEDRLPDRNGRYLTHCNIERQSLVCILYYSKVGGFNEGTVTHWMPLPEPPRKEDEGK